MSFSEWKEYRLGDIVDSISEKHKFDKDKIILINTSDVLEGKVLNHVYVENENLKGQFKKSFKKGDILYSEIRPKNKRFAFVDFDSEDYIASTKLMVLRKSSEDVHLNFLFQILKSDNIINMLQVLAETRSGTFPQITYNELANLKIKLPTIKEQKAIANILSTLDEKIETNNQINKKLEEMAQAIFKHWFIDFEFPNEEGKPYKSSGGEMIEREMGMIPKGWKVGTFREYTDSVLGGDWGKEKPQGNYTKEVYCLRGADIPEVREGKKGALPKRYILEKNYNNKKLSQGDLVVEISGGSPTQSTGRISYINEFMLSKYDADFVCTNFCKAITLSNNDVLEFFYFYWDYLYNIGVFFQYENGTTGIKNFDINTFLDKFLMVKPPKEIIYKFHNVVKSLLNTIQSNGSENIKLSEIRDILLPKLMSGEIRVPLE
ncbi:restriction endonuclease subunit S [Clostridium botulinum]|uniref:restriction endonuclease subunit S n=1 Tax=Clostridium botulinum TaxID=1491 RepID=UPI0004D82A49|nr:restriction endonuclease subunit S [Clostridium botulinum]KEH94190.1 hypothetical protein Z963_10945 [Clostridium botulinum C/D str. It1]